MQQLVGGSVGTFTCFFGSTIAWRLKHQLLPTNLEVVQKKATQFMLACCLLFVILLSDSVCLLITSLFLEKNM